MPISRRIACSLAIAAATVPGAAPAQSNAADELYHVEVILFAYTEADRLEEDFFHGIDNPRLLPEPSRLHLPDIPLESVFVSRADPFGGEPEAATDSFADGTTDGASGQSAGARTGADDTEIAAGVDPASGLLVPGSLAEVDAAGAETQAADSFELIEVSPERQRAVDRDPPATAVRLPEGFRPLTDDELELGTVRRRLNGLRAYRVLRHIGWEQTGVDPDRSIPIDLKTLGITNPTGTIEVYRMRFLHVTFDLEYFDGQGTLWRQPSGLGLAPFEFAQRYPLISELNAIRSGGPPQLVDHPLFGILIQIRRAPARGSGSGAGSGAPGPAG